MPTSYEHLQLLVTAAGRYPLNRIGAILRDNTGGVHQFVAMILLYQIIELASPPHWRIGHILDFAAPSKVQNV